MTSHDYHTGTLRSVDSSLKKWTTILYRPSTDDPRTDTAAISVKDYHTADIVTYSAILCSPDYGEYIVKP